MFIRASGGRKKSEKFVSTKGTIAGKIQKAINSNESIGKDGTDTDKKVEAVAVGSTVKITTANAGANKVVNISDAPKFTAN